MKNLIIKKMLQLQKLREDNSQSQSGRSPEEGVSPDILKGLEKLSNEDIIEIMKPATAKFVVYRHTDSEVVGWRRNCVGLCDDESISIIDFADTVEEALSKKSM